MNNKFESIHTVTKEVLNKLSDAHIFSELIDKL